MYKYGGFQRCQRVLDKILCDTNAICRSTGQYFGARILLPVFRKPEVEMADLPEGYNMVYKVLAFT